MKQEFEFIKHPQIKYINIFLNRISYRTPHLHSDFEIALVLEGELILHTKQSEKIISENNFILLNPNEIHEFITNKDPALLLFLQVSPEFFAETFPIISTLIFNYPDLNDYLNVKVFKEAQNILLSMAKAYYIKETGYQLKCCMLIYELFYLFISKLPYQMQTQEQIKYDYTKAAKLKRIINYINVHYQDNIRLSDLAASEHLSVSYLSHFIKDNISISFQDYINKLRVNHAIELIHNSDLRLIDISLECGYSDYRYFHKTFIKEFKCSPGQYKKEGKYQSSKKVKIHDKTAEKYYSDKESFNYLQNFD